MLLVWLESWPRMLGIWDGVPWAAIFSAGFCLCSKDYATPYGVCRYSQNWAPIKIGVSTHVSEPKCPLHQLLIFEGKYERSHDNSRENYERYFYEDLIRKSKIWLRARRGSFLRHRVQISTQIPAYYVGSGTIFRQSFRVPSPLQYSHPYNSIKWLHISILRINI